MAADVQDLPAARPRFRPVRLLQWVAIWAPVGYLVVCGVLYFCWGSLGILLGCTVAIYAAGCLLIYLLQNGMTYPRAATGAILPMEEAIGIAAEVGLVPWRSSASGDGELQGYIRPDFKEAMPRGTIVLFHGNGGWCAHREGYIDIFARRGFRSFLYEYPGYGGRLGRPGEREIVPDARALIRSLDREGYGPVYVWGESLGAGVAAAVCAEPTLPVRGVVLLTPWDNIANVGRSIYPYIPARFLMIDKYDSIANLAKFPYPVCVVRSEFDEVIPPRLTENLIRHLTGSTKVILHSNCGHENWPNAPDLAWWDEALDFVAPPVR